MHKFNLDVSLVARLGGHSAPRTYRDPHLCFDSDGEEDCRKVRQGENDHQSTGDGVDHEWWCVFDECVNFCKKKRRRRRRRVRVFAHWCHLVVRRRDHRHSDGAVPVPRVRLQAGDVQRQVPVGEPVLHSCEQHRIPSAIGCRCVQGLPRAAFPGRRHQHWRRRSGTPLRI